MDISDQVIYAGCWVVLALYIITTLLVFTQRSCVSCAASFLFACILWVDLTIFNIWFFLPALARHTRELDLQYDNPIRLVQVLLASDAAEDICLMMLGWFGSCLSISNAANMLETEGCRAVGLHNHGRFAKYTISLVYQVREYVGMEDFTAFGPFTTSAASRPVRQRSLLFAIPRFVHAYISRPTAVLPPLNPASKE
ncbi:hypothetical protein F5Y19DRAFT_137574 [Xylariaceae sp. FL1651]|nr:hypothetical protein F5Y19DRAFT_137574 [Xylariaceae sp. FL1651]